MNLFNNFPIVEGLPRQDRKDLRLMMRAARHAGRLIVNAYDQLQVIEEKEYGNLVSQVDNDCDGIIHKTIGRARPGEVILSEERDPHADVSSGRAWVVDPLDATSAMLFRSSPDMPSVMIARLQDGEATSSVVHFPLTDEWFYAVRGLGAYKGKQRLECKDERLENAWIEMNQHADASKESPVFRSLREKLRSPGNARLVSSSPPHSGVGVRIAEGRKRLSAVIHDNDPNNHDPAKAKQAPWDVFAAALILREAGGVVVNFDAQPYDPFKPEPFIMAASNKLAEKIRALA